MSLYNMNNNYFLLNYNLLCTVFYENQKQKCNKYNYVYYKYYIIYKDNIYKKHTIIIYFILSQN